MKKMLIIDGNSIINRAFYGIRLLTNKHGMYTNGIYGFLNIMLKHTEELEPDYIAVAFDLKAPTFRHKMFSDYKAQRKGMPEELRVQMPVMKEILSAMNITILEKEGFEADDIIGTVSRMCRESDVECYVLTGDKDDLQLATDTTKILLTVTKGGVTTTTELDSDDVEDTYGVTPTQFIDVKGLMGDTSDNVPGVKGIGEKTAFEYIKKFKSIETLYENLDDSIVKPAARQKLIDGKDMAFLSKKLCTIDCNVPLEFAVEDAKVKEYNKPRLAELYTNLEFQVFLKKLGNDANVSDFEYKPFEEIEDVAKAEKMLSGIEGDFMYKLFREDGKLIAFAFLHDEKVCFIRGEENALAGALKNIMESNRVLKISADVKSDMVLLHKYGINFNSSYYDISVAAYIANPLKNSYDISSMAMEFLEVSLKDEKEYFKTGKGQKTLFELEEEELKEYVSGCISAGILLKNTLEEKIENDGQKELFLDVELPLVWVLASMEIKGVLIDRENLEDFNNNLKTSIDVLEKEIYELAGEEFNLNSPKQLGVILFEKLGMKPPKKTKTGYSTNAEVLEKLAGENVIVQKILEYRQLAKLKSTYGDGLLAVIDENTGRVYSRFNQTVTVTGRISSQEPNLQNIPVRTPLGRELRKMFIAKEGCVFVDADYSQIELRVLAHISGDEALCNAFNNGVDIHTLTASNVFGVNLDEVTDTMRSHAKTVNFGIIYGMGEYSLAKDLGINVKEAREYISNYFDKYRGVNNYMNSIIESTKEAGYVETMFKRRRKITEINSSNFMLRSAAERMTRNTPIQGSAADIIKIAMIAVEKRLREEELKSALILQIHDELIIEAYEDEVEKVKEILKESMENAAKLSVPLVAEANCGKSWYDAK